MRILFAGSPEIAVPSLEILARLSLETGSFEAAGILTNPDSPKGRHGTPEPTPVGASAAVWAETFEARGRPPPVLLKPEKLNAGVRETVAALKPDLLVSFAYGRIFGPQFLALFPRGGVNIHPSLLPKYRGPTPIQAAILGGDRETGITIQRLAPEMDAGDILAQERFPLNGRETTPVLSGLVAGKAPVLLERVLWDFYRGSPAGRPQNSREASYCSLLSKEDGRIDWRRGAGDIDAQVRAFTPWPLAWTEHGGQALHILEGQPREAPGSLAREAPGTVLGVDKQGGILVQTGDGVFIVSRLQYRARKALQWRVFLNGVRDFIGSRLI